MTYGVDFKNNDGDTIINTDDNLAAFKVTSGGVTTPLTGPVTLPSGNYVLAAPPSGFNGSDGVVTLKKSSGYSTGAYPYFETQGSPPASGNPQLRHLVIEPMVGAVNPSTSGYGIEVYNSNGPTNGNVIFSSQVNCGIGIIAMGEFGGSEFNSETYFDVNIPTGVSLNNVFVLISNTILAGPYYTSPPGPWQNFQFWINYTYDFASTQKKVRVNSYHHLLRSPTTIIEQTIASYHQGRVWAVFNIQGVS